MSEVPSRELRNNTRALLDRVGLGEEVTITVDGRPVAVLHPVTQRSTWISREDFTTRILRRQADHGLTQELRELSPDSTDELPL